MDANTALALAIPSVIAGVTLAGFGFALRSREKQGCRIGRLEQWIDKEDGRRLGRAEVRAELAAGRDGK